MDLANRTALVTGGAMGIGLAIVQRLLNEGVRVIIWDLNQDALDRTAGQLSLSHGQVETCCIDITDREAVKTQAGAVLERHGAVDILINNAGFVSGGTFLERPVEDWSRTVDVNLTAMFYTTAAFLPAMYDQGVGHVVNISSAAGVVGVSGLSAYCGAKWAVLGFTESLRHEAVNRKARNVRFTSMHPGYIATGMFEGARIGGLGRFVVPLVKNHDVIAKAIVEDGLKKKKKIIFRPRTIVLSQILRGILPYSWFLWIVRLLSIHTSMETFEGRKESA